MDSQSRKHDNCRTKSAARVRELRARSEGSDRSEYGQVSAEPETSRIETSQDAASRLFKQRRARTRVSRLLDTNEPGLAPPAHSSGGERSERHGVRSTAGAHINGYAQDEYLY